MSAQSEETQSPPSPHTHVADEDIEGRASPSLSAEKSDARKPTQTTFWAPELAGMRKDYLSNLGKALFLITVVIWACWALYWGSLYKQFPNAHKLHGWVINRDPDGFIGQQMTSALEAISMGAAGPVHLTWDVIDANRFTDAEIADEVGLQESTWAAIIIGQNASAALQTARETGDASWDPASTVTLVYSEARSQQAVAGLVVASTNSGLQPYIGRLNSQLAAQYLSANSGNATALDLLIRAPQTIANPVALGTNNVRPYAAKNIHNGAVLAATYVGLIYMTIATFNVVMANFAVRMPISSRLTLASLVKMRILIPLIIYLWLSLSFTLMQSAFHLDFNGWGRGYGAGFMTFWMISWSAMAAIGMMLECVFSLVGPAFIAFFLVFLIISNVSGALLPLELSPGFYKYSLAMPYYNIKTAFLTIFCNTGRHILLLRYVGVLWAWLALCLLTFPIWIWLERRRAAKAAGAGAGAASGRPGH